ncbi:hypothetical protein Tco_0023881 [Tanacetum coccineum]
MRTKPGVDSLSFDDLYNNLRVFESDIKGSTASSSSNSQNVAFVFENTSNTNEVSTAYYVPNLSGQNSKNGLIVASGHDLNDNEKTQPRESESQTSEFDTCESNISAEPSELVSEPVVNESNVECQPKVWSDAPIIEEYESDSEDECVVIPTKQKVTPSFANQQVKTPRENVKSQFTHSQKPKVDKKDLGHGFTVRACFVCGSLNHLIRDCDFHEKRMARKAELNNGWNNVQNQFVPSAVLTRTGIIPVNTARTSAHCE